jgi:hypothetical protein
MTMKTMTTKKRMSRSKREGIVSTRQRIISSPHTIHSTHGDYVVVSILNDGDMAMPCLDIHYELIAYLH